MLKKVYIAFLILLSVLTVLVMVTPLEFENYFYFLISFWLTITLNSLYFFKYIKNKYLKVISIISIVISVLVSILMFPIFMFSKIEGTNKNNIAFFGNLDYGNGFILSKSYVLINHFLYFNLESIKKYWSENNLEELKKNYLIPKKDFAEIMSCLKTDGDTYTFIFPEEKFAVFALQEKVYKRK